MGAGNSFTLRDWFGLVGGVCWGLILSRFFASDDMTGPWLLILFGPPVVLLISSARPILSWQLPIVTAIVAGVCVNRASEDSAGFAPVEAGAMWLLCSVFSSPWALIFQQRSRRRAERRDAETFPAAYVGVGLLLFFTCALTLLRFAATMEPTAFGESEKHPLPLYGVVMATAGIGLSIVSAQIAQKLEVHKPVRAILELIMIPGIVFGVACFGWLDDPGWNPVAHEISGVAVGLEALGAMIWMTRADRRGETPSLK
jgi:hypothetical protein